VAVPVETPVTTPVVFTLATAALPVDHTPPEVSIGQGNGGTDTHAVGPVMEPALAVVLTVMATEVVAVPQEVVDV